MGEKTRRMLEEAAVEAGDAENVLIQMESSI